MVSTVHLVYYFKETDWRQGYCYEDRMLWTGLHSWLLSWAIMTESRWTRVSIEFPADKKLSSTNSHVG